MPRLNKEYSQPPLSDMCSDGPTRADELGKPELLERKLMGYKTGCAPSLALSPVLPMVDVAPLPAKTVCILVALLLFVEALVSVN